ncbi:unnamed protein product [Lymnaea stagnalis]|uniref:UDENN FLCN/SMCR8-type domain-containing protein n=1 Tax=Lymnaea stagnalis TaxID=6523 RepID=A0AAV2HLS1_LYMST
MFGEYAQIATYLQQTRDEAIYNENNFQGSLPAYLCPPYVPPQPWNNGKNRHSQFEDFIMVAEFSELEGPKPVLTIPKDGGANFDQNTFAVRILAVDHQNSADGFTITEDAQVVVSDLETGVYSFVHRLVLYDNSARGFVRPYCIAYVTMDDKKLMYYYEDISQQLKKVARYLKYGNKMLFVGDLERHLKDLEYTKGYLLNQVSKMRLKDETVNGQVNDMRKNAENELYRTLQTIQQSSSEIKDILSVLKPLLSDKRLENRFRLLEDKAYQQPITGGQDKLSLQENWFNDLSTLEELDMRCGSLNEPRLSPLSLFKPRDYKPIIVETKKAKRFNVPLRGLHELCSWGAKEGLRKLRHVHDYFKRDLMILELEKNESRLFRPCYARISHGQCVTGNFMAGVHMKHSLNGPGDDPEAWSVYSHQWGSLGSTESLDSFKSAGSYSSLPGSPSSLNTYDSAYGFQSAASSPPNNITLLTENEYYPDMDLPLEQPIHSLASKTNEKSANSPLTESMEKDSQSKRDVEPGESVIPEMTAPAVRTSGSNYCRTLESNLSFLSLCPSDLDDADGSKMVQPCGAQSDISDTCLHHQDKLNFSAGLTDVSGKSKTAPAFINKTAPVFVSELYGDTRDHNSQGGLNISCMAPIKHDASGDINKEVFHSCSECEKKIENNNNLGLDNSLHKDMDCLSQSGLFNLENMLAYETAVALNAKETHDSTVCSQQNNFSSGKHNADDEKTSGYNSQSSIVMSTENSLVQEFHIGAMSPNGNPAGDAEVDVVVLRENSNTATEENGQKRDSKSKLTSLLNQEDLENSLKVLSTTSSPVDETRTSNSQKINSLKMPSKFDEAFLGPETPSSDIFHTPCENSSNDSPLKISSDLSTNYSQSAISRRPLTSKGSQTGLGDEDNASSQRLRFESDASSAFTEISIRDLFPHLLDSSSGSPGVKNTLGASFDLCDGRGTKDFGTDHPGSTSRGIWKPRCGKYTVGDWMNNFSSLRPGSCLLEVLSSYQHMKHIIFSLLSGRPVLVAGSAKYETEVIKLVRALAAFVPTARRKRHAVLEWTLKPLKIVDLTKLKLVGVCRPEKRSLDSFIPCAIKKTCSIVDVEKRTILAAPYQGNFITMLMSKRKVFKSDVQLLSYIEWWLMDIMSKAFMFFHIFCLNSDGSILYSHSPKDQRDNYFRTVSGIMAKLGIKDCDCEIIEHLTEMVKMARMESHIWQGVDSGSIVYPLRLHQKACQLFRC